MGWSLLCLLRRIASDSRKLLFGSSVSKIEVATLRIAFERMVRKWAVRGVLSDGNLSHIRRFEESSITRYCDLTINNYYISTPTITKDFIKYLYRADLMLSKLESNVQLQELQNSNAILKEVLYI